MSIVQAAKQYQLEMLKNICEKKLCNLQQHQPPYPWVPVPGPQSQEDVPEVCFEEHEHHGLERVTQPVPRPHGGCERVKEKEHEKIVQRAPWASGVLMRSGPVLLHLILYVNNRG